MRKEQNLVCFILIIIALLITPAVGLDSLLTQQDLTRNNNQNSSIVGTILWTYTSPTDAIFSVAVGDFNGDGTDDALAGGEEANVYAIDGRTGTTIWINSAPEIWIQALAVGDFNGDGTDDAVAGDGAGNVLAIDGSSGTTLWTYTTPLWNIWCITTGDFNEDGTDDALAGGMCREGGFDNIFAIDGSTGASLWNYTTMAAMVVSVAVGDFNGNDIDDVLAGDTNGNVITINGSTGTELWNYTIPTPYPGGRVWYVAVGDLNEDGIADALAGSKDSNVYALDGPTGALLWNYTTPMDDIWSVAVGDFNGDGRDDVIAGGDDTTVYAIEGGTGTTLWNNTSPNDLIRSLAVGDFNGDGRDDALAGSYDTTVYAINGINGNTLWTNDDANGTIYSVAVGDFNDNGLADALAGSVDDNVYAIEYTPKTKLEVTLVVSKTYLDLTNDWTIARAIVTNVGAFPAYYVRAILHGPDGTDKTITYWKILSSCSESMMWNLTSGNGLPTVKIPDQSKIDYTISVEIQAINSPYVMDSVPIIIDPPLGEDSSRNNDSLIKLSPNSVLIIAVFLFPIISLMGFGYLQRKRRIDV